ncbi:hypothetical protein SVAN01_06480 [Stagonosporopsis vannaccii]|nr:hypothetical protein SVAN01_06480 [Stagonosporopsis vannaccii]
MDRSHDSILSMGEYRPMVASPHMSPQLNETICGCRCGCGCGCAGDGDVDESERLSDSVTAIESSGSEDGEGHPLIRHTPEIRVNGNDSGHTNVGILAPRAMSRSVIVWLLERREDLHIAEGLLSQGHISALPLLYEINAETPGNPIHEPRSMEFRTNTMPSQGNVQMVSPGPGIGAWLPKILEGSHVERVYILTPLRLSAESQHVR